MNKIFKKKEILKSSFAPKFLTFQFGMVPDVTLTLPIQTFHISFLKTSIEHCTFNQMVVVSAFSMTSINLEVQISYSSHFPKKYLLHIDKGFYLRFHKVD